MSLRVRARHAAILAILASSAALPAGAEAGALSAVSGGTEINYTAPAGQDNTLTVSRQGASYLFTDSTAPVAPVAPCAAVNANSATCPAAGVVFIQIVLEDLDDETTIDASVPGDGIADRVSIDGGPGDDRLTGGANVENNLAGRAGDDVLTGGAGDDEISGGDENDTVTGGAGDDSLSDGDGNDTASGGPGDDEFGPQFIADGPDIFSGGTGVDRISYYRPVDISVSTNDVADDGAAGEGDNVKRGMEEVATGDGNDTIELGAGANEVFPGTGDDRVQTGAGDDRINGFEGNDVLAGGSGADFLEGGTGADRLAGGAGDDALVGGEFDADGSPDVLDGGRGNDFAIFDSIESLPQRLSIDGRPNDGPAGEGDNIKRSVENVIAGSGNDVITGSRQANELFGDSGNDRISGGAGSDLVDGSSGNDRLSGGRGIDGLFGDSGKDRLNSRDGGPDDVSCGALVDQVTADRRDRPRLDCEKVIRPRRRGR